MNTNSIEVYLKSIDPLINVNLVNDVISLSNNSNIFFHGIKNGKHIHKIREEGIRPLTPEGKSSYWARGERAFRSDRNRFIGMDTPIFHYAIDSQNNLYTLASSHFKENKDLLMVPRIVPADQLHIIQMPLDTPNLYSIVLSSVLNNY